MKDITRMGGPRDLVPKEVLCQNCKLRPGTETWVADAGVLGLLHGMHQRWCSLCVVKEQLKYAREKAAAIPALEQQLRELE